MSWSATIRGAQVLNGRGVAVGVKVVSGIPAVGDRIDGVDCEVVSVSRWSHSEDVLELLVRGREQYKLRSMRTLSGGAE